MKELVSAFTEISRSFWIYIFSESLQFFYQVQNHSYQNIRRNKSCNQTEQIKQSRHHVSVSEKSNQPPQQQHNQNKQCNVDQDSHVYEAYFVYFSNRAMFPVFSFQNYRTVVDQIDIQSTYL